MTLGTGKQTMCRRVKSRKNKILTKANRETTCRPKHIEDGTNPWKSKFKEKMCRSKPGRAVPRGS